MAQRVPKTNQLILSRYEPSLAPSISTGSMRRRALRLCSASRRRHEASKTHCGEGPWRLTRSVVITGKRLIAFAPVRFGRPRSVTVAPVPLARSRYSSRAAHCLGDLAGDNDRLHDSYHRCFDTSLPDTAEACPPARPLPILQGLSCDFSVRTICLSLVSRATCPIRFLLTTSVSDRLQTVVSALASPVSPPVRGRAATRYGPGSRT
jgi:hypothetical protein